MIKHASEPNEVYEIGSMTTILGEYLPHPPCRRSFVPIAKLYNTIRQSVWLENVILTCHLPKNQHEIQKEITSTFGNLVGLRR